MPVFIRDFVPKLLHALKFARDQRSITRFFSEYGVKNGTALYMGPMASLINQKSRGVFNGPMGKKHGSTNKNGEHTHLCDGDIVDLAVWLGFGPSDETLNFLNRNQSNLGNGIPPDPISKTAFQILDNWKEETANCVCWHAFTGKPGHLISSKLLSNKFVIPEDKTESFLRGLPIDEFCEIFFQLRDQLVFRIPTRLYGQENANNAKEFLIQVGNIWLKTNGPSDITQVEKTNLFTGVQQEFLSPKFKTIFDRLRAASNVKDDDERPVLLTEMDFLPANPLLYGRARQQKFSFFGAKKSKFYRVVSPLEYVGAGVAASRRVANLAFNAISGQVEACAAYTLTSRQKHGKSIALAQIANSLCNISGAFTLWQIGDRNSNWKDLNVNAVEQLLKYLDGIDFHPSRITLIIDDFSFLDRDDADRILDMFDQCMVGLGSRDLKFSFVIATDDNSLVLDAKNEFPLKLTDVDKSEIYNLMSSIAPAVVNPFPGGLEAIMLQYPEERQYNDSITGFIDYILDHSTLLVEPAQESQELAASTRVLHQALAAPQAFDVPVPTNLGEKVFKQLGVENSHDHDSLRNSYGFSVFQDSAGSGFGLSSARHAIKLLKQTDGYHTQSFKDLLKPYFDSALEKTADGTYALSPINGSFLRHLLQRLTKPEYYKLDKIECNQIANGLYTQFNKEIFQALLNTHDIQQLAKWAGTLSKLQTFSVRTDGAQYSASVTVFRLCNRIIKKYKDTISKNPEVSLSLMKAASRLARFHESYDMGVAKLIIEIESSIQIYDVIKLQLDGSAPDTQYRVNELFHAYCALICRGKKPTDWNDEDRGKVAKCFNELDEQFLKTGGMILDAGNWIRRSQSVIISGASDLAGQIKALEYLNAARNQTRNKQASWAAKVEQARNKLFKDFPSLT